MVNWKGALSNGFRTSDRQNSSRPDTRASSTFVHSHNYRTILELLWTRLAELTNLNSRRVCRRRPHDRFASLSVRQAAHTAYHLCRSPITAETCDLVLDGESE